MNNNMVTPEQIMHDTDDGRVYTAIFETFRWQMDRVLDDYKVPSEDHYDQLMDFYFFLRDNKNGPFYSYLTIKAEHKEASRAQWLRTVLRNYLNRKQIKELMEIQVPLDEEMEMMGEEDPVFVVHDVRMAVDVLDRVNKTFSAPERVVFFYDLEAVCDDSEFPTERAMKLLSCTEGNLRVMKHRVKKKVRGIVKEMEEKL